jgi:DNA-binding MarR family transcriptional regulator
MSNEKYHQLQMLETLETNPEITQADLAAQVGVAVGTVNWYLKQWSQKGLLKVRQIGRWRWQYILTPKGITEKTRLARKYFEHSMRVYRRTRDDARNILGEVIGAGYARVIIDADEDLADIFNLTCLEMGLECISANSEESLPRVMVDGSRFTLHMPASTLQEEDDSLFEDLEE